MIQLRPIRTNDASYAFVENLFLTAFPEDERRDIEAQRYNTDNNLLFHCYLAEEDNEPVGFFTFWDFGAFCYGEHFAIAPNRRNGGYGQQTIRALLKLINRPMVLEVELPKEEMSRRRIGFYERQGFTLWEKVPYMQPPYREGGHSIPMYLMATDGLNPKEDFEHVKQCIYKEVYLVENNFPSLKQV